MVDMFIETELTKSLLVKATLQLDSNDKDASRTISALKVQVGKARKISWTARCSTAWRHGC